MLNLIHTTERSTRVRLTSTTTSTAPKSLKLFKLDQENLHLKLEEWKKSSPPNMRAHFRPYMQVECSENNKITNPHTKPGGYIGSTGGDDSWNTVIGTSDDRSQTFLFVHQEEWQGDLPSVCWMPPTRPRCVISHSSLSV